MKFKRFLAALMAAAMLVSAPGMNLNVLAANETGAQMMAEETETQKPENVADAESLTPLPVDGVQTTEDIASNPEQAQTEAATSEEEKAEGETGLTEPGENAVQGDGVIWEEAEKDQVDVDLTRKDALNQEALKDLIPGEEEMVRVIILMDDDSILDQDIDAELNWFTRIRIGLMESKQNSIVNKIEDKVFDGEDLEVRYNYTWVLNGVATEVPYGKISEIEEMKGVDKVVLQSEYSVYDTTESDGTYTIGDGEMIGRENTWSSGYTGKGIKIAIIDTGLDGDHPSFAALSEDKLTVDSATEDSIGSVLKDTNAAKLYSGLSASDVYRSTKVPYAFNYVDESLTYDHSKDSQGDHGTHVAGIAAANELESTESGDVPSVGVAPDAQLYVMKVFGINGGAYTEDLLAAVEDSLILGADVINMSLGSSAGFTSEGELLDEVYGKVSATNTILAVAAGNSATSGEGNLWGTGQNLTSNPDNSTISSPATYVNATSVASVDNEKTLSDYIEINGKKLAYEDGANGANEALGTLGGQSLDYAMVPNMGQSAEDFAEADVAGKIAVVQRGETAFTAKCQLAQEAGAIACLIYNNVSGTISMDLSNLDATIPCASITMAAGEYLASAKESDADVKILVGEEKDIIPSETAYQMSSFSSWGVSPDLSLEPDVTAPGGNIYSTLDGGTYGLMSGTSMASPNMAGVSALVSQYVKANFPNMSESEQHVFINSLIMSTATTLMYDESIPYSPRSQGAGLVNAYSAIKTDSYLTVDGIDTPKVELKDDPGKTGVYNYTFHVHNFGSSDSYYDVNTNAQTEGVASYEGLDKIFMSSTPIALEAETSETSDNLIYTYDYSENGGCTIYDAYLFYLKAKYNETTGDDSFRYDLNGDEAKDYSDVQLYLDMLVQKETNVDFTEQVLKVAAGDDADVDVSVVLTENDRTYMDTYFENGIYVEGYTTLTAKSANDFDLSLPYLAFYGDWMQAPILDGGYYWQDDDTLAESASQYYNILFTYLGYNEWVPGLNPYIDEDFDPANVSLSPNQDGYLDYIADIYVSLLRNAKSLSFTYEDAENPDQIYFETTVDYVPKSYYVSSYGICVPYVYSWYGDDYELTGEDGKPLANNTKLNLSIQAELDYDNGYGGTNVSDSWVTPITVDTEAPALKAASYEKTEDGRYLLTVTINDNVGTAAVNIVNKSGISVVNDADGNPMQFEVINENGEKDVAGEDFTMTIDVTGAGNQFYVVLGDYALNESYWVMYTEGNDPVIDTEKLYGYRVADSQIYDDTLYGWLSIDQNDASTEEMSSEYYMDYSLIAAEYVGGYIIAVDANKDLVAITPGYWDSRVKIASLGINIRDMAFDRTTNTLYAYDSTNWKFVTIDIFTGEVKALSNSYVTPVCIALACDDNGVLYGIKQDTYGSFCTVDKNTGEWGDTLFETYDITGKYNPTYSQSMTYDSTNDCIYWAGYYFGWMGSSGVLYQIDPDQKTLTNVGTIAGNAEVVGLLKLDDKDYQVPEEELQSISLNKDQLTLLEDTNSTLEVVYNPWNSVKEGIEWSSADETIATVNSNGQVTAVGVGETTVTASVVGQPGLIASCTVKVVYPTSVLHAFVMSGNYTLYNQWVTFPVNDFDATIVNTEQDYMTYYAGEYYDGYIYAYSSATELYKIDPDTYDAKKISEARNDYIMMDMAFDYSSGYMYGLAQNLYGEMELVEIDILTGDLLSLGYIYDEFYNSAYTLAISTEGIMYVTTSSGMLYTCDVTDDGPELTLVGSLGYTPSTYTQSMAYDHNTGELYMAIITNSGLVSVIYIDKESGAAIPLGAVDGGSQMTSMYVVPETVPEREYVEVEAVNAKEDVLTILEGGSKCMPVEILPYNATDRNISWNVEDSSIAQIEDGIVTGLKPGTTTAVGTLKEFTVTITIEVLPAAGDLYGFVMSDFGSYGELFWGKFHDNDLSSGEGLVEAYTYEVFAGEYYDGKIYAVGPDEDTYVDQFMVIDAETYELEKVVTGDYPDMHDMAFDYTTGVMYGVGGVRNVDDGTSKLYMIDITSGKCFEIAKLEHNIMTLACTDEGVLYGVDEYGTFYEISADTGTLEELFYTGYEATAYQSMTYDRGTGNLYWAQTSMDWMTWQTNADLLIVRPQQQTVVKLGKIGTAGCEVTALHTRPDVETEMTEPAISRVILDTESKMISVGDSFTLTAVPYPLSVLKEDVEITFTSKDPEIATVDADGLVTGVNAGSTEIIATCDGVSGSCTVNVVDENKLLYIMNSTGWQTSPLLKPGSVNDVSLPDDTELVMKSVTVLNDGYFYALDENDCLWKFTEDRNEIIQLSDQPVTEWLGDDFEGEYPQIIDLETNGSGDLYVLLSAELLEEGNYYSTRKDFIYKLDLEKNEVTFVSEIPEDVGYPVEFSFTGEHECILYDYYQDYIFSFNLRTGELKEIAWPQGVFVSSETIGMTYSRELNMIFVATLEDYYTYTMGLYVIDPSTGKVELVGDAAYSEDMKDLILVEGIELAEGTKTTAVSETDTVSQSETAAEPETGE